MHELRLLWVLQKQRRSYANGLLAKASVSALWERPVKATCLDQANSSVFWGTTREIIEKLIADNAKVRLTFWPTSSEQGGRAG